MTVDVHEGALPVSIMDHLEDRRAQVLRPFDQGGGQVRLLELADGSHQVLKWMHTHHRDLHQLRAAAQLVDELRRRGWPFPYVREVAQVEEYLVSIEDFCEGAHPSDITDGLFDQMLAMNRAARGGGGGEGQSWATTLLAGLDGADAKISIGALTSSEVGRQALREARRAVVSLSGRPVVDLVHGDFSPGNVLVDAQGALAAVIDWEGVRAGDGAFDLVTLEWDLALWGRSVGQRLPELRAGLAARSTPEAVRAYEWYLTCRNLSWATGTPDEEAVRDTAQTLMGPS